MHSEDKRNIVLRLTTLWAMIESGLGGVLHLFQIPFSGVVLTAFSICILCLIYHFAENKFIQLTESLFLVLLIKYSISPHTSPTAAIAVSFQCLLSFVVYSVFSISWFSILVVSIFSFLESAFQKILVLFLIYGKELASIIDDFVVKISMQWINLEGLTSSQSILMYYAFVYLLGALISSYLINNLYYSIVEKDNSLFNNLSLSDLSILHLSPEVKKKKRVHFMSLIIITILIAILVIVSGYKDMIFILLRSLIMIVIWIFIILPVANYILKRYLDKKKEKYQLKLDELQSIFPRIRAAFYWAMDQSKLMPWNKKVFHIPYYIIGFTLFAKE